MLEEYGHVQTMRTGVTRCYKHDTNTYGVSMGYGFMLLKKEMQTTDKTCIVTRWTKQAFLCSKFLSPGGQLWANTAFEGSQFYSIGVPKFYSWVNVISVYAYYDLG